MVLKDIKCYQWLLQLNKKFKVCAIGASGAFPNVVPLVHNCGSAIWLSSLFSEKISDSGRSNDGSGSTRLLGKECP